MGASSMTGPLDMGYGGAASGVPGAHAAGEVDSAQGCLTGVGVGPGDPQLMTLAALRAIEEGTFGVCQTCGKRIGKSRLRARPYAKNCVSCQTEMERDAARRRASPSSEFYN